MKKITSLFILMTMLPFVANAEIASKAYVDEQDDNLIFGGRDITDGFEHVAFDTMEDFIDNGGVVGFVDQAYGKFSQRISDGTEAIWDVVGDDPHTGLRGEVRNKVDKPGSSKGVAYSNGEGEVYYDNSFNSEYIGDGGIAWKSINLPTPPAACAGTGGSCVLMFVGNDNPAQQKISWEIITRAPTGDAPSTTGAVTTGQYSTNTIGSAFNNN